MSNLQSKAKGSVVYLSWRTLLSLVVLPIVLSHIAGRLLRESWVLGPYNGASSQPSGGHHSVPSEGECTVGNYSGSHQFLFAHNNNNIHARASCIGYRRPTSRTLESMDFDTNERKTGFYEGLVHPAMFSHENPVRIAVVVGGGGGGKDEEAVVSEVLKHKTVKQVEVFGGTNGTSTCTSGNSDPRVIRLCSNPAESLSGVFLRRETVGQAPYDVIVWNSDRYLISFEIADALAKSLSSTGILVVRPPTGRKDFADRHRLMEELERVGFRCIINYDVLQPNSEFVQNKIRGIFLIAMKERSSRANWFVNQADVQLAMLKRTLPVLNNAESSPFRYFDGATMMSLKFPSRLEENEFCRLEPLEEDCVAGHGFDPEVPNVPASSLEVKISGVGEKSGRGVFARERILQGSIVGLEESVQAMYIPTSTYSLIRDIFYDEEVDFFDRWQVLYKYIDGYGWLDNEYGKPRSSVDPGIVTFMNHGCNGTYNVGRHLNVTEQDAVVGVGADANGFDEDYGVYDPLGDRRHPDWDSFSTLKDVEVGEELLDNYLIYGGDGGSDESDEEWEINLAELKRMCSGDSVGTVKEYEDSLKHVGLKGTP